MPHSISARVLLMQVMLLSKTSSSAQTCEILSFYTNNNTLAVLCSFDASSAFLVTSWFQASFQSSTFTFACCLSQVFLRVPFFLGRGSSSASWKCSSSSSVSSSNWPSKEAMWSSFACRALCFLGETSFNDMKGSW